MKRIITIALLIFIAGSISAQSDNSRKRVYTDNTDLTLKRDMPAVYIPAHSSLFGSGEAIQKIRCPFVKYTYVWVGDESLFVSMEYRVFNDRLSKGPIRMYNSSNYPILN